MLATTTRNTLSVADGGLLKKAPSSLPSCLDLIEEPIASSWSPDNSFLFIASATSIHKYDPSSNILRDVYSGEILNPIQHIFAKDQNTVIFAAGSNVYELDCSGPESSILRTFDSHKSTITSLSISVDNTLLASASSNGVHVFNLALGSHTVLRGFGNGVADISHALFHLHSRTRLIVAMGRQISIYDTTRPSGPVKVIPLSDSAPGDVIAIACSPFSKTLLAVATSGGFVALLDLEKEKAHVRTVNSKTALTSIEFSPEGGALYLGTEQGKILIVDLRGLDKPPKTIIISETGCPIQTISIQRKAKFSTDTSSKTPKSATTTTAKTPSNPVPSVRRTASTTTGSTSKAAPSPISSRTVNAPVTATPPSRRGSSTLKESASASTAKGATTKKVLSPVRDPHGNSKAVSAKIDEIAQRRHEKPTIVTPVKVVKKVSKDNLKGRPSPSRVTIGLTGRSQSVTATSDLGTMEPRRARTLPTTTSTLAPVAATSRKTSITTNVSAANQLHVPSASPPQRLRAASSASRAGLEVPTGSVSAVSSTTSRSARLTSTSVSQPSLSISRSGSSLSIASGSGKPCSASRPSSSATGSSSARDMASRTPSPELPDSLEPVTPVAASKQQNPTKKTGMSVLGLGTPEVDRWIQAGQQNDDDINAKDGRTKKGKTVGFKDDEKSDEEGEDVEVPKEQDLSLQISPRRPVPSGSGSTIDSWAALAANSPIPTGSASGSPSAPGGTSAHDLLKTIVQDVMFDFQRETKSEMMGLHLDLLRMGRSWKTELRGLMDEYVGDLRDLREENERLRRENEKLRRGWD